MASPVYAYGKYMSRNMEVFKRLLNVQVKEVIKPKVVDMLRKVAELMIGYIDNSFLPEATAEEKGGSDEFPAYTNNLHDATGIGLYVDGALFHYVPNPRAFAAQYSEGHPAIWGSEYLMEAISASQRFFGEGVWIVLFSAVPYAYEIETKGSPIYRGKNFFNMAAHEMADKIFANLKPIDPEFKISGDLTLEFYP